MALDTNAVEGGYKDFSRRSGLKPYTEASFEAYWKELRRKHRLWTNEKIDMEIAWLKDRFGKKRAARRLETRNQAAKKK